MRLASLCTAVVAASLTGGSIAYTELTDASLTSVPSGGDDFDINAGKLLAPLLIPRVPGTDGQTKAQQHFVSFFRDQLPAWETIWQNSTSTTPAHGTRQIPFNNLLFRREPPWLREQGAQGQSSLLTLVAHYDSKMTPDGFIGATDSAAPCAMLMHIARTLDALLTQKWDGMRSQVEAGEYVEGQDIGVQILLLDGEEAFVLWTGTDNTYGARSLAEEWENAVHPFSSAFRNPLDQIELFVLLDLLGSAKPSVPSYFLPTHWAYQHMSRIETRMRDLGLLETSDITSPFLPQADKDSTLFSKSGVSDDHLPFMGRGVPILHIIPTPFPAVWHKSTDDGEHLDLPTVRDWAKIATAFAMEWLNLGS